MARAEQHEGEGGGEGDGGREQRAADPPARVADRGDRVDDGAGRDLPERDGAEELGGGHPVVAPTASACISGTMTKPPP